MTARESAPPIRGGDCGREGGINSSKIPCFRKYFPVFPLAADWRAFPLSNAIEFASETLARAISANAVAEISRAAFRGLLFVRAERATKSIIQRYRHAKTGRTDDLLSAEAEPRSLLSPVSRQL
jgi:hypothetical protein